MFKKIKFISYLAGSLLSSLLFIPTIAKAQIKVAPMTIEMKAERGQSKGVINITNQGDTTFRARVYAAPFTYNRDGFESLDSSPNDLSSYLTFSPRELVIEPKQTRSIRVVSRLLPSMAKGEYRAVLFTENLQEIESKSGNATVGIVPRIGMTVFVRHGDVTPNLTIKDARFNPQTKNIQLLVSNTGNATALPKTEWKLTQGGTIVGKGSIYSTTIIAEGERYIQISDVLTQQKISAGNYELSGELIWGNDKKPNKLPFKVGLNISSEQAETANKTKDNQQQQQTQPGINRN